MARFIPPLFTRLYLSMIAALCGSILVTIFFSELFLEQSDIVDFAEDTHYIFSELSADVKRSGLDPKQYFETLSLNNFHFKIDWQDHWSGTLDCEGCEFLDDMDGTLIYRLSEHQFLAAYPLANSDSAILISDRVPSTIFSDNIDGDTLEAIWHEDPDALIPFLLLGVAILLIGATLYYPVRQLQSQINQLIDTNLRFGQGELGARANPNLSEPVNALADSFNQMAESITDTVKENQVFAQAVPHEMRTPLSRIQLATGLLRKTCDQGREQGLLDDIDSYIDDIDELTKQVLTFSRLNAAPSPGALQSKQRLKLADYLKSRVSHLNQQQDIEVVLLAGEETLECDPAYLRLLFDNLVKNALRYAASKVIVSVVAGDRAHGDNSLIICVDDDGPGIESKDFELIFIPFARLDKSRSQLTGGLGLGLAIAKAAARRMSGELNVGSSPTGGARFSFSLQG